MAVMPPLPPSPAVRLRTMTPDDVEHGLRLCRASGWNQIARDWVQLLAADPGGAAVAVDVVTDRVVGSVATIRYGAAAALRPWHHPVQAPRVPEPEPALLPPTLAWIAMVLVDPDRRSAGIGTALLDEALRRSREATCQGLDATALGRPLYEKLGFGVACTFTRMVRSEADAPVVADDSHVGPGLVRPATPADAAAMAELDARATGLDRGAMLRWLWQGAPELAWVHVGPSGIDGAILGRPGFEATHVGPVVASSSSAARALVHAVLARLPGRRVFIDTADDPGWLDALAALGFHPQRAFARMYRGPWPPPSDPAWLRASIGPEFG